MCAIPNGTETALSGAVKFHQLAFALAIPVLANCMVGSDEAANSTSGSSVAIQRGLQGCHGNASTSVPSNGRYVLTTFGGAGDHQAMSCGGYANGTGWYAASRQRYGCGAKLRVEANGKCVVVQAQDYGPDSCVERAAGLPILDASPKVSKELFGENGAGYSDRLIVMVTEVGSATPVGICATTPPTPDDDDQPAPLPSGTCDSATLGREVPAGTCVQARSDGDWYQCNGDVWVTPVDEAAQSGPLGHCTSFNPL